MKPEVIYKRLKVVHISRSHHVAIAKCIRNAEVPEPHRTSLLRDLCVLFEQDNPHFDSNRFLAIAHGGNVKDAAFVNWKEFDTFKYLDSVWEKLNETKSI